MPSTNVKQLCEDAREKLKISIEQLESFLNRYSLPELSGEQQEGDNAEPFYKGLLSDLRHLLVFSEVSYEKLGVALRRPNFDTEFAERALYEVYHQCVNAYFYPKNEGYSEDGRYAYTGRMRFASCSNLFSMQRILYWAYPKCMRNCVMTSHIMRATI